MFYAGWNYDVRMKLVRMYGRDSEVHVRKEVPPSEYVDRMLSAKFCPVCGGFSQWTPRLAEAIYYECVPVILSPHMLPPWSEILDWSTFAVRLDPTAATLKGLKAHLASLDHASLFRNVRAAKHALTYQLDGYTGADLLPLLPCETHKRAAVTSWCAIIRRRPAAAAAVRDAQARGGVHTAAEGGARALQQRRGGARLRRRRSQRALAEGPRGERHVFAPVRAGGAALLDVRRRDEERSARATEDTRASRRGAARRRTATCAPAARRGPGRPAYGQVVLAPHRLLRPWAVSCPPRWRGVPKAPAHSGSCLAPCPPAPTTSMSMVCVEKCTPAQTRPRTCPTSPRRHRRRSRTGVRFRGGLEPGSDPAPRRPARGGGVERDGPRARASPFDVNEGLCMF